MESDLPLVINESIAIISTGNKAALLVHNRTSTRVTIQKGTKLARAVPLREVQNIKGVHFVPAQSDQEVHELPPGGD